MRWGLAIDADDFRLSPTASSERFSFHLLRSGAALREGYWRLRSAIFCQEQHLFEESDRDELDRIAYPIAAVSHDGTHPGAVVGVVRILEERPGLWYGGRLGVDAAFRRHNQIGKGLIWKAVTTANGWGCERFLATVQLQNVRFFQRLHWRSIEEIEIRGVAHHLMEATWPTTARAGNGARTPRRPRGCGRPHERRLRSGRPLRTAAAARRAQRQARHPGPAERFAHQPFPGLGPAAALGDDAALLPASGSPLLLACEGLQPELVAEDPWFAGWCGVLVNLSDIAAMGGRPLALVNSLWCRDPQRAEPLLAGLRHGCDTFGVRWWGATPTCAAPTTPSRWRCSAARRGRCSRPGWPGPGRPVCC